MGQQAAANVIAFRTGDGAFAALPPFVGSNETGVWRPTTSYLPPPPPSGAPFAAEFLAYMTPYAIQSSSQFRPQGPPALNSGRYRKDYNEVKRLGGDVNSERTQEQTDLATFWNLNFGVQWQRAVRDIAAAHVDNISDSSRLFALVTLSMADAMITVWDSKRHFMLWRPVTAIQEGDDDGNPHTDGDVNWRPLINTPPYPDFSSGANGVSWAAVRALKLYFGTDHFTFVYTSNNLAAIPPTREVHAFLGCRRADHRGPHPPGHSLPLRRRGGREAGPQGGQLCLQQRPAPRRRRLRTLQTARGRRLISGRFSAT